MRLGIVSDIHGNIAGLTKAVEAMGPVDELVCLGDSINQYRFSNEVVRFLRDRRIPTILGNHEEVFFSAASVRARQHSWIDRDLLQWLSERPKQIQLQVAGKSLLIVHSTPWSPGGDYVTPESAAFQRFGETSADIVLYGHTHRQTATRVGRTLVVNPGSAGEGDAASGGFQLSCAVLDVAAEDASLIEFSL